ncbi:phospholipase A2 inhibitor and Ly6/PLAUR domain-containing protein [Pleuronectes platessa]|uniref:phospholipase A2 inhibitor and Ly6/PLAUR domain-containing protein n=1 Tax=Pleuronectes platessa TaxID=8262 RepID=UPI00232A6720|nr:phospholipase A2 inhibitor and Ly6/PLAUR domain-containing protein [Pleuronectes platessa]
MMQLFGALVLFTTLSTACGLRCYTCTATEPKSCTDTTSCAVLFNRCYSTDLAGLVVTKGCINDKLCVGGIACCEGDLCNSATLTGPSTILLLVSSAIITLFL